LTPKSGVGLTKTDEECSEKLKTALTATRRSVGLGRRYAWSRRQPASSDSMFEPADVNEDGQRFSAYQGWFLVTLLTIGYLINRGLAKSGSPDDTR
jgi:hypothetical protein